VAKDTERLAVNEQISHRFHLERLSLKKLSKVEGKEHYHFEESDSFIALEDLDS
jgi:hypothetical protein